MKPKSFPGVPLELLKALEEKFPDTLPDNLTVTVDELRYLQGNQHVIRFLKRQYEKQNENIFTLNGN